MRYGTAIKVGSFSLLCLLLAPLCSGKPQSLHGRLFFEGFNETVSQARICLIEPAVSSWQGDENSCLALARTDEAGAFTLEVPRTGYFHRY